jgi:hypothetical protein
MDRSTLGVLRSLILYFTLAAAGLCLMNVDAVASEPGDTLSGHLKGIKPFPLDHDSGSMAVYALKSAVGPHFPRATYRYLVGVSCAAFKFVYDSLEAYEPLRDASPVDVLTTAANALGFDEAHWELGLPIDAVTELVRQEIDSGRPVIAPFLKPDAYHGFCIITGYDLERKIFYLQGAFGRSGAAVTVPIPESWDGPTVSPAGWATNPIFIVGPKTNKYLSSAEIARPMFEQGIRLMKGGTVAYGTHPGEARYMSGPGQYEAFYGLPAFDALSADVEQEPLVLGVGGGQTVNFGFIWRVDAQVGQLAHDRRAAAEVMTTLTNSVPADRFREVRYGVREFERISEDARGLREVFWCVIPDSLTTAADVSSYISESTSMVFSVPEDESLQNQLRKDGYGVFKTLWGWVAIDDTHEKRMLAKTKLRRIIVRERDQIGLLERILDYIDQPAKLRGSRRSRERDG